MTLLLHVIIDRRIDHGCFALMHLIRNVHGIKSNILRKFVKIFIRKNKTLMLKWTLRKTYKHDRSRKMNTLFQRAQPSDERYDINSSWAIWELDASSILFEK